MNFRIFILVSLLSQFINSCDFKITSPRKNSTVFTKCQIEELGKFNFETTAGPILIEGIGLPNQLVSIEILDLDNHSELLLSTDVYADIHGKWSVQVDLVFKKRPNSFINQFPVEIIAISEDSDCPGVSSVIFTIECQGEKEVCTKPFDILTSTIFAKYG